MMPSSNQIQTINSILDAEVSISQIIANNLSHDEISKVKEMISYHEHKRLSNDELEDIKSIIKSYKVIKSFFYGVIITIIGASFYFGVHLGTLDTKVSNIEKQIDDDKKEFDKKLEEQKKELDKKSKK